MEDNKLERIKKIADKAFTYNKDINQHIESCRMSMKLLNKIDDKIDILKNMLEKRDEEIRKLEEHNLTESKEFREVITEQYKLIRDLSKKNLS